jgi:arginine-tRNA-protein transferase
VNVIERILSDPETCSYLPDREARLEFRLILHVEPAMMDRFLVRGWRRFGFAYFRPACRGCTECVSLRIPVATFHASRAQRRVRRTSSALRTVLGEPRVDEVRLEMFRRWHADRAATRGWKHQPIDADRYEVEFAAPNPCARELSWWDDGRLVGVGLVVETPLAFSAVYTYFDPDYAAASIGTATILELVDLARTRGKRWVYLGYRVLGCPSSEYKDRFRPHEIARGWPDLREPPPAWTPADHDG